MSLTNSSNINRTDLPKTAEKSVLEAYQAEELKKLDKPINHPNDSSRVNIYLQT